MPTTGRPSEGRLAHRLALGRSAYSQLVELGHAGPYSDKREGLEAPEPQWAAQLLAMGCAKRVPARTPGLWGHLVVPVHDPHDTLIRCTVRGGTQGSEVVCMYPWVAEGDVEGWRALALASVHHAQLLDVLRDYSADSTSAGLEIGGVQSSHNGPLLAEYNADVLDPSSAGGWQRPRHWDPGPVAEFRATPGGVSHPGSGRLVARVSMQPIPWAPHVELRDVEAQLEPTGLHLLILAALAAQERDPRQAPAGRRLHGAGWDLDVAEQALRQLQAHGYVAADAVIAYR